MSEQQAAADAAQLKTELLRLQAECAKNERLRAQFAQLACSMFTDNAKLRLQLQKLEGSASIAAPPPPAAAAPAPTGPGSNSAEELAQKSAALEAAQRELALVRQQLAEEQRRVSELQSTNAALVNTSAQSQALVAQAQAQTQAVAAQAAQGQQQLQAQVAELTQQLQQEREKSQKLTIVVRPLKEQLDQQKARADQLEQQNATLSSQLRTLQQQHQHQQQQQALRSPATAARQAQAHSPLQPGTPAQRQRQAQPQPQQPQQQQQQQTLSGWDELDKLLENGMRDLERFNQENHELLEQHAHREQARHTSAVPAAGAPPQDPGNVLGNLAATLQQQQQSQQRSFAMK